MVLKSLTNYLQFFIIIINNNNNITLRVDVYVEEVLWGVSI